MGLWAEEKINELKDIAVDFIQTEAHRGTKQD